MKNLVLLQSVPLLMLFLIPLVTFARIEINEIMYDLPKEIGADKDREWIELYNSGSSDVNLTGWKFDDGAPSKHGLNAPPKNGSRGSLTISAGEFIILSGKADTFIIDHPEYSGTVIDTVMSLNNTSETILLLDENGNIVDSVSYTKDLGANSDGNSLQHVSGEWVAGIPTPGEANTASTAAPYFPDESGEKSQTIQTTSISSSFPTEPQITTYAGENRVVIVGADTEFKGEALGLKGEPLAGARYQWNMGNGELKEGKAILHFYHYPGEYVVILSVSSGRYAASDRLIVTAVTAQVNISKANADLIELRNGSDVELNLSWWILKAGKKLFTIPKDTLILAGRTLVFSDEVTQLAVVDPYDVELLYPNGVAAYHYDSAAGGNEQTLTGVGNTFKVSAEIIDTTEAGKTFAVKNTKSVIAKASVKGEPTIEDEQDLDDTQVASVLSGSEYAGGDTDSSIYKWLLALVSIISVAAIGVLLRRRKVGEEEIKILD